MTASVTSPEDLVNLALTRIGYAPRITNIYEGSRAANAAINIYAQTRDELLRMNDWDFAERNINATLLKSAPPGGYFPPNTWNPTQYPALPWLYQYAYPGDLIKMRSVRKVPLFVMDFDPQPNVFSISNDNTLAPPQKVVLSNVENAVFVYTGQVTDLTTWEPDAVEAFAATLGRRLAALLVGMDSAKMESADEQQTDLVADEEEG